MGAINTTIGYAFGTGTVSSTAISLSSLTGIDAAALASASRMKLTVLTNSIRFRYDGVADPTVSVGHLWEVTNGILTIDGNNVQKLRLIRNGGSDATVAVTLEN